MRVWITLIAGASLLAVGTRAGVAQEDRRGPPGPSHFFERLDADKDGKIVFDEIPESIPEQFKAMLKRADRNGDKSVTKDELASAMQGMRSGRPGPEGRDAGPSRGFGPPWSGRSQMGPDAQRGRERGPEGPPRFGRPGEGPPGPPAGHRGPRSEGRPAGRPEGRPDFDRSRAPGGESFLGKFDKNGDGKLDKEEAVGRMKENFDRIDANKDGSIDREEGRRAMMAAMKMRMQGHSPFGKPGLGRPPFGSPSFGRGPQAGLGNPRFQGRQSFMAQRGWGYGFHRGFAMRGPGSQRFGRPPMGRGWGRGPQMGRGMQGPAGPRFGRPPMAHGPRGPMMSHRGFGRGPQMGRGAEGPVGPRFDRAPMAYGARGPMMSHRGFGRGPHFGRPGPGRGPRAESRRDRPGGSKFHPSRNARGPHAGPGARERSIDEPRAAAKTRKAPPREVDKKPARPKKPVEKKPETEEKSEN